MFNSIAHSYDFLNHFLSVGIDFYWRKIAVKQLKNLNLNSKVLDLATGTGDLAIEINKQFDANVFGTDIASGMLKTGLAKIQGKKIAFACGDAENLPYKNKTFDASTIAFGIRNCENIEKALSEMHRVTKFQVLILEFSKPEKAVFKQFYLFYFKSILPLVGKIFSKHNNAYSYLPASVMKFPEKEDFLKILGKVGFTEIKVLPLTFGIVSVYSMKV
ncbi:bifunctional demethylmenaquinone methyltransferase/2-methoxy-6-polyprenyl-1,4-benzoquinol methylase UbiE [bacterium]|nr:bifunctional demethylmenaquinone methyltransferase/2-methoxy-6-polyprenyl-1,4-benzoquinol methylase UbiE [bacterium]